jgi:pimeloyl-ACP methyl ester carboxylesterase
VEHIEVDGLRIGYERAGEGPLLLLLHGYVGDGRTTWGPQLDGLADEFTVVAWDAPGAGASSDPPETFGMPGYADCLAGFVRGLGLGPPHVAGLSFGGALALAFHHRHPTVARTLVLASAYAGWAGSLSRDVAEQRLRQALELARAVARRARHHAASDHVLGGGARTLRRWLRRRDAGIPSHRVPGHGPRIRRGPA